MAEEKLPLCECGCGERVSKVGNRFIIGHNSRGRKLSPDHRKKISTSIAKVKKVISDAVTEYYKDPVNRDAAGDRTTKYFIDHPEARKSARLRTIEQMGNPEVRNGLSKVMKQIYIDNPEIWDDRNEMMRGGHDIIKHHFIYDHDHPENHTVEITRSEHTSHHHWMMRNGLSVPYVNITEENKNIFRREYNG